MKLQVDDTIHDVEAVWLGPPGHTLPIRARYIAWGVGLVVFALLEITEIQVGLTNPMFITYTAAASVLITRSLMKLVDYERPISTVIAALWHEICAPREITKGTEVEFRLPRTAREI
jgi:hypothetical protein